MNTVYPNGRGSRCGASKGRRGGRQSIRWRSIVFTGVGVRVPFPSSDRSTVLRVRRPRLRGGRGGGRASATDGESTGGRRASAAPRVPSASYAVARARFKESLELVSTAHERAGARPAASAARRAAARASFFGYLVVCHALRYWYVSVSERASRPIARVAFER